MRAAAALSLGVLLASALAADSAAQTPPPSDPFSPPSRWRDLIVGTAVPPPIMPRRPIAMVDGQIDVSHPAFRDSNITSLGSRPVTEHTGTANAAVAAVPAQSNGLVGVWPGASVVNIPLPNPQAITCSHSARGIARALRTPAEVIYLPYAGTGRCDADEAQILRAVRGGRVVVAAGGMQGESGSPAAYPASLPHVLTVGAVGVDSQPTAFSSTSAALDISAPGDRVATAIAVALDSNGDGYGLMSGTAVAGSMVAAAVAWVRAARPELTVRQAADAVRLGARDVGVSGRDSATGHGILWIPGALARPEPPEDPFEPNDDIRLVDGRFFGRAAMPLSAAGTSHVEGTIDRYEDPADVYRIRIPGGRRVRVSLSPSHGDPDLYVLGRKAKQVTDRRRELGRSRRGIGRADIVTVRNRRPKPMTGYVVVRFSTAKQSALADASYEIALTRR